MLYFLTLTHFCTEVIESLLKQLFSWRNIFWINAANISFSKFAKWSQIQTKACSLMFTS